MHSSLAISAVLSSAASGDLEKEAKCSAQSILLLKSPRDSFSLRDQPFPEKHTKR